MILRAVAVAMGALLLMATNEPPPVPAALASYIEDGRFSPGDYGWMKGRFEDATPEEAAAYLSIVRWSSDCRETALVELREQLAAEGFPDAKVENTFPGPFLCRAVASQPLIADDSSFGDFAREVALARPIADAYILAAENAAKAARPRSDDLSRQLKAHTVGEQVIRMGLTWATNPDSDFPPMSDLGRAIVQSRLGLAMAEHDRANTEWLKSVVQERGWPRASEVGEEGASAAWLLVQHADHDPLFQFRALRMMEPLVAEGEVSPNDYAYLTDRVMLKLAGKQRYGTQYYCVDGQYTPQPLEDEAAVAGLRREAGMETLEENIARMRTSYGAC